MQLNVVGQVRQCAAAIAVQERKGDASKMQPLRRCVVTPTRERRSDGRGRYVVVMDERRQAFVAGEECIVTGNERTQFGGLLLVLGQARALVGLAQAVNVGHVDPTLRWITFKRGNRIL